MWLRKLFGKRSKGPGFQPHRNARVTTRRGERRLLKLEPLEERTLLSLSSNPLAHTAPFADVIVQESTLPDTPAFHPLAAPASFDLRAGGYVTPVKDEGGCLTSWTFATYGSLESSILVEGGPARDLSENHLKNYNGFDYGPCGGGTSAMSQAYLTRWSGPVDEVDDPYQPSDDRPSPGGPRQYYVRESLVFDTDDEMKDALMTYGALFTNMRWEDGSYNSSDDTYYYAGGDNTDHAVTIVGWDDGKVTAATNPGAWLAKNSWGTGWGDSGYFWIAYQDTKGANSGVSFRDAVAPDTFSNVYYHDEFGAVTELNNPYAFNAFTPTADEALTAVQFWTQVDGADYDVRIYDTFSGGTLSDPLATTTGTIAFAGHHTIDLPSEVPLTTGDTFYVYLGIANGGALPQAFDWAAPGYSSSSTASPGESYYSFDGNTWTDLTAYRNTANFSIKALTVAAPDFGDAPDPTYPTLLASDGARHTLGGALYLGTAVDGESDGQPNATATGDDLAGTDDEDGVIFLNPLEPGKTANLTVTATAAGLLNAWVDFNDDGDWGDADEQIFTNEAVAAGPNGLSFPVPAGATVTPQTFARFRVNTAGGLAPTGPADDGEVEDYEVEILAADFGDAPDPTYPTLLASNGARHSIGGTLFLGAGVDQDSDGQPDATATGDDLDGNDDEDGVVFAGPLQAGGTTNVTVTASGAGLLDAWVDFNDDGDWADPGEQIFTNHALAAGPNALGFAVPATAAITPQTFARFRASTAGSLTPAGPADDGEVEDYEIEITKLDLVITADDLGGNGMNNGTPDEFRLVRNGAVLEVYIDGIPSRSFIYDSLGSITIAGSDDDDTLIVDYSGGNPVPAGGVDFQGNGQDTLGDSLQIVNGTAALVEHTFTNAQNGDVDLDGSTITYTGLEPIIDTITATTREFTFTGGDETITLSDDGDVDDNESLIDSTLGESVNFTNPTALLVINATNGGDTVNVAGLDGLFAANLTIEAVQDTGSDLVDVTAATGTGGGDLTVRAEQITLGSTVDSGGGSVLLEGDDVAINAGLLSGGGSVTVDADNDITFNASGLIDTQSGSPAVDLTAGRNIDMADGSSINAAGGPISLDAFEDLFLGRLVTTGAAKVATTGLAGGGFITDAGDAGGADVEAASLVIDAVQQVGDPSDAIETAVANLEGSATGFGVFIDNTGPLVIGGILPGPYGIDAGNVVRVEAASPITVAENIRGSEITLFAREGAADAPGDDLTINTGVTIDSGGAINLTAGDDFSLEAGATLDTSGAITIQVDDAATDNDSFGSTVTIDPTATINGSGLTITAGDDVDIFELGPNPTTPITVRGEDPPFPSDPGDTLDLDLTGVVGMGIASTVPGDAILTSTSHAQLDWFSIEKVIMELVIDANLDPAPGDQANDGTADDFLIQLDPTGTNVEIYVNGSLVYDLPLAGITGITVNGSDDDDTLTVNSANGLVTLVDGITFDGNAIPHAPPRPDDTDTLILEGDPGISIARETYLVGATEDAGTWILDPDGSMGPGATGATTGDEQVITFTGLEPIDTDVPAAVFDVIMNTAADDATVEDGGLLGGANALQVTDNGATFETFRFANKTTVRIMGQSGADNVTVDYTTPAAGLTTMEIYGHVAPLVLGQPGDDNAADRFDVEATAATIATSAFGQGGNDLFDVEKAGDVDEILGALTVDGGTGNDDLVVDDTGSLGGSETVTLTSTTITGITGSGGGGGPITYLSLGAGTVTLSSNAAGHDYNVESTAAGLAETELNTGGGVDTILVADGAGTANGVVSPIDLNTQGNVDDFLGIIDVADPAGNVIHLSATQIGGGAFGGPVTPGGVFGPGGILDYDGDLEQLLVVGPDAPGADNTYNIDATGVGLTEGTGQVDIGDGQGNAVFNIRGDQLAAPANHTLWGDPGNDRFVLNVTADLGGTSLVIWGDDPAGDPANRDVLEINDSGAGVRTLSIDYPTPVSGNVEITGYAVPVDVRRMETVSYTGSGNDEVTVVATTAPDLLVVTPTGPNSADVELDPGVSGGALGPDLSLAGLDPTDGLMIDGSTPAFPSDPGDTLFYNDPGPAFLDFAGPGAGKISQIPAGTIIDVNFREIEFLDSTNPFGIVIDADDAGPGNINDLSGDDFLIQLDAATGTSVEIFVNGVPLTPIALNKVDSVLFNGSDDDDTLTVNAANGLVTLPGGIFFDGEGIPDSPRRPNIDTLILSGDPAIQVARETYTVTGPDSGVIVLDANGDEQVVTFSNLQPVISITPVLQLDMFTTAAGDTINVVDGPGFGGFTTTEINDGGTATFESLEFANKITVTVNGLDGADNITLNNPNPADGLLTLALYGNELTGGALESDDSAADRFDVEATAVGITTSAFGQGGNDLFDVEKGGDVDEILGALTVDGGTGNDDLVVDDTGSLAGSELVVLTGTTVDGLTGAGGGGGLITYLSLNAGTVTLSSNAAGHDYNVEFTAAGLSETELNTGGGVDTIVVGSGAGTANGVVSPIDLNTQGNVGDLLAIVDIADPAGNVVHITATQIGGGAFGGPVTPGGIFGPGGILDYDGDLERLEVFGPDAPGADNTYNIDATGLGLTEGAGWVDIEDGEGNAVFNIQGDQLAAPAGHIFSGNEGTDTFNVNLAAGAVVSGSSLMIFGDDPTGDTGTRDVVNVVDAGGARTTTVTYQSPAGQALVDIDGGTPIDISFVEQLNAPGDGGNDDAVTVVGSAGDDDLAVVPTGANAALVFTGGDPWNGPDTDGDFFDQFPGSAGGGAGPDLNLGDVVAGGILVDGGVGEDQVYVHAPSESNLVHAPTQAAAVDPFGYGAGVIIPGAAALGLPDAFDDIDVTDAGVTITTSGGPLLPVNLVTPSFVQSDPLVAGLIVNSGFETLPGADDVADDIVVTPSLNFAIQINGGDPDPDADPGDTIPPDGDRLTILMAMDEVNVWATKPTDPADQPVVTIEGMGGGTTAMGVEFSSIETVVLDTTATAQTLNIYGDNNDPDVDQNDDFVLIGTDVDSLLPPIPGAQDRFQPDTDGRNELTLEINGSVPIGFRNITTINVFGDDELMTPSAGPDDVDRLEITPYADDTPLGWGIDVRFDEGNPVLDADWADLVVYNGVAGVSEEIIVAPSGPGTGQLIVNNAANGTPILVLDYTTNTGIEINGNDGSAGDTDTLTLRGTDGVTPLTSGEEDVVADFSAAGDAANPIVSVTDYQTAAVLYQLINFSNFDAIDFELGDGDDKMLIIGRTNGANVDMDTVNVLAGAGDDRLLFDNTNAFADMPGGIFYDGGPGSDNVGLYGTTAVDQATYRVGPNHDEGALRHQLGPQITVEVDFQGVEAVDESVAASRLEVFANDADNAIGVTGYFVTVDGFASLRHFGSPDSIEIRGFGGDDVITVELPLRGPVVQLVEASDADQLRVEGNYYEVNETLTVRPSTSEVVSSGGATVFYGGVGAISLVGQLFENDMFAVEGTANSDLFQVFTGDTPDTGTIRGTFDVGGVARALPEITFSGMSPAGLHRINDGAVGGIDVVTFTGTAGNDNVTYSGGILSNSIGGVPVANFVVGSVAGGGSTVAVQIETLDGDDTVTVQPEAGLAVVVNGGNPDASDSLTFTGTGGAIAIDLDAETITEAGLGPVSFSGVEHVNLDAAAANVTVNGTPGDDSLTFAPDGPDSGSLSPAGLNTQFRLAAVGDLAVDGLAGSDELTVNATQDDDTIDVSDATVDVNGLQVVDFSGFEALTVGGLFGNDTINVTAGSIPIFIDGGDPIGTTAGDLLNLLAGGDPVSYEPGPEDDEGGFLVGSNARISFDHIEEFTIDGGGGPVIILGTNADDDITVIARDDSYDPAADGVQDFTVSVNEGPNVLYINAGTLYIDALAGDDDIVIRAPAPNAADWDVDVFVAGGPPSASDRLVIETPGTETVSYAPTGADTGTLVLDQAAPTVIEIGPFTTPVLPGYPNGYTSSPGGVEHLVYDGENGADAVEITLDALLDDMAAFVFDPMTGIASVTVNTAGAPRLGIRLQNISAAGSLTLSDSGLADADALAYLGTAASDLIEVTPAGTITNFGSVFPALATSGIDALSLEGLGGDDTFLINQPNPFVGIRVDGQEPGSSDLLQVVGAGGVDEAFQVFPSAVAGSGAVIVGVAPISYNGVEDVHLFGQFFGIGSDNDTLVVHDDTASNVWDFEQGRLLNGFRVQIDDRETIELAGFEDVTLQNGPVTPAGWDVFRVHPASGVIGSLTIDGAGDVLEVFGTGAADAFTLTPTGAATTSLAVDFTGIVQLNAFGLEGADTFTVTPSADTAVFIDGGAPVGVLQSGGDVLDVLAGGGAFQFNPGPEPDSGNVLVAGNEAVSFDQIELLLIDGEVFLLPDDLEPNDSIAGATVLGSLPKITLRDLTLHNEGAGVINDDYFQITAQDTGKLVINAFFSHALGNVDIEVLDAVGTLIDSSVSGTDNEQVVIPVVSQERYFLHVFSADRNPNTYDLEIENFEAPTPAGVFLSSAYDSGQSNLDNVTFEEQPQLFIQAWLDDFAAEGITILDAAQVALGDPGAAVEVFINGASVGIADPLGPSKNFFTFTVPASELAGGLPVGFPADPDAHGYMNFVSASVRVYDGQAAQASDHVDLSDATRITFDPNAPLPPTIALASYADSGVLGDGVTGVNPLAFVGTGEANAVVRIFAERVVVGQPSGVVELVGEGLVHSDESDGDPADGLGIWEVTIEPVVDGTYLFSAELEDLAGNISDDAEQAQLELTVDTLPPQRPTMDLVDPHDTGSSDLDNVTIGDPSLLPETGIADFRISAEPDSLVQVKDGEVVIDSFVFDAAFDLTDGVADGFGLLTIDFNANEVLFGIPSEGPHPLSAEAFDAADNRSAQSEELLVTIDTTAPATPSTPDLLADSDSGELDDDNVTNVASPAFEGTGEANALVRIWAENQVTGAIQLVGEGRVGSDESDLDPTDGLGIWEVTIEPLADGVYEISAELEDLAGNLSLLSDELVIEIDTYQPNTAMLDLVAADDTGRHNNDNVTNVTVLRNPTFDMTTEDPNEADHLIAENLRFRVFDRLEGSAEVLLFDSFGFLGNFTPLNVLSQALSQALNDPNGPALADGVHNLKLEVEDRAGNISQDFLLEVVIDTVAPPVAIAAIDPATSDTGVEGFQDTFADRITSDTATGFYGSAEANAVVRLYADAVGNSLIGNPADFSLTVAVPLDGNEAFPEGQWNTAFIRDLNDPAFPLDGLREVGVTAEDLAGNVSDPDFLEIFIDTQGPRVTDVYVTGSPGYDLFDPKPSDGPTPLVESLSIDVRDLPDRVTGFLYEALINGDPTLDLGNYEVRGDFNGIIPIESVQFNPDPAVDGLPATGTLVLNFVTPLPDDRFTLTISDNVVDPAGNALDGETNAIEPQETPELPSGDGVSGGDFTARFTIDSRPEVGVWAAGSVWVDTNGNFLSDPDNPDYVNRDITYVMGYTSDDVFAGNFAQQPGDTADGFDKLAAYGRVDGQFRWLVDTDNDGAIKPGPVPNPNEDVAQNDPANINGVPFAGRFDNNDVNGDEVGVFQASVTEPGSVFHFDTDHDFMVDFSLASDLQGYPIVGDFDGDGFDDLATWSDDVFQVDLAGGARRGWDGVADFSFGIGFIGVRERPVAADMDRDGIDDFGLWVPDRSGTAPMEQGEWYFLISGGAPVTDRIVPDPVRGDPVVEFTPVPFGNDLYGRFGDEFSVPVLGNFDPPVTRDGGDPEAAIQHFNGTPDDDTFEFVAGPTADSWVVTVNGEVQDVLPATAGIRFDGLGGNDVLNFTGTDRDDVADLWAHGGTFTGIGYSLTVWNVEQINADALDGGNDGLRFSGDAGDDTVKAWPGSALMVGAEYSHSATGFETVQASSGGGENDRAYLYDSAGDDTLEATPTQATLSGDGYSNQAVGFPLVISVSRYGGFDTAQMVDSSGDDEFIGKPEYSKLRGDGFYHYVKWFDEVSASADAGGSDVASLFGSAGDETFIGWPSGESTFLGDGYTLNATSFETVQAFAYARGYDVAVLHDSPGDDRLIVRSRFGRLTGGGFDTRVRFFDRVEGVADGGGTDAAYFFDSTGDDVFTASPASAKLRTSIFLGKASGFESYEARADSGGFDRAYFYDSSGDDTLSATPRVSQLTGTGFSLRTKLFDAVYAIGNGGGHDVAHLYGSSGDDTFVGKPNNSKLYGEGYQIVAKPFEEVYAHAGAGGSDRAFLYDSELDDLLQVSSGWARLSNQELDFLYEVYAFDFVKGTSTAGSDTQDVDPGIDFLELTGDWQE